MFQKMKYGVLTSADMRLELCRLKSEYNMMWKTGASVAEVILQINKIKGIETMLSDS